MTPNNVMPAGARPVDVRVAQSLLRLGYKSIQVADLGGGQVKLSGSVPTEDDRAIVIAAARAVAGVKSVVNDLG